MLVLKVIETNPVLNSTSRVVTERFWDMFVVDSVYRKQ